MGMLKQISKKGRRPNGCLPFCFGEIKKEEHTTMKDKLIAQRKSRIGKITYLVFLIPTLAAVFCTPVSAATVWDKASEIMKDVY